MKLRNKKTGEVGYTAVLHSKAIVIMDENAIQLASYTSLAELNDEWEDAPEELKRYWYIDDSGAIQIDQVLSSEINMRKVIGNYFETKKEAEKAVEKLKAWKRMKDKGISFEDKVIDRKWYLAPKAEPQQRTFDEARDVYKDIRFVFGMEE